jgi:hypothetical protein
LLLAHFFGEAPERRPWIPKHDEAGRSLPGFIFAFVFYLVDLPTDCSTEPILGCAIRALAGRPLKDRQ